MAKTYSIRRLCKVWVDETYVLDGTDEENEAKLREQVKLPDYNRMYDSFEVKNETLEELFPSENGGCDTVEIIDGKPPRDISLT